MDESPGCVGYLRGGFVLCFAYFRKGKHYYEQEIYYREETGPSLPQHIDVLDDAFYGAACNAGSIGG